MKQVLLVLSIVFFSSLAMAQQEVQYTNFMFSKINFNPGFTGMGDGICLNGLARQQWMGYKGTDEEGGAPNTYYFAVQSPVKLLMGGVGLMITKDQIGFEDNTSVRLAYSFHLNLGEGTLGIGLQGGFINKQIDFAKFRPTDPNDPILQSKAVESAMSFDLAFGAFYKAPKYYAGISSTQMQGFWGGQAEFSSKLASPEYKGHYFLTGGYYWQLPMAPEFTINPNILVKTDFASAQFDINALAWYNNQLYAGVTYRPTDAISVLAGYKVQTGFLNGLMAGVSYDITTSAMSAGTSGSFEIYLKYCFNIIIEPKHEKHGTVLYL
jgi:type IX secretion system PorP/SprF family membrane protein